MVLWVHLKDPRVFRGSYITPEGRQEGGENDENLGDEMMRDIGGGGGDHMQQLGAYMIRVIVMGRMVPTNEMKRVMRG